MKKTFLIQLLLLICGALLLILSINSIIYYISLFQAGFTFSSWVVILDFIVDLIVTAFEIISCGFAIAVFIKLKDDYIDSVVRLGIIMLIAGGVSLVFSIAAGEFSSPTWQYEIFESIAYIAFPCGYFVLALLLNHFAE